MGHISSLAAKFEPYILKVNDPVLQKRQLREKLDRIFAHARQSSPLSDPAFVMLGGFAGRKEHVVEHRDLPGWIIKGTRHDEHADRTVDDSNIYRVRKASKLERLFQQNGVKGCRMPIKYLYQLQNGEWLVIAEKIPLKPFRKDAVSDEHARAIAIAASDAQLNDVHDYNVGYDEKNNLVFFDTEPRLRDVKKQIKKAASGLVTRLMLPFVNHLASLTSLGALYWDLGQRKAVLEVMRARSREFRISRAWQLSIGLLATAALAAQAVRSQATLAIALFASSCLTLALAVERTYELCHSIFKLRYVQTATFQMTRKNG